MSLQLENLAQVPAWKLIAGWVVGALLLVGGWHTLYYSDAVTARDQEKQTVIRNKAEREELEAKLAGFEEEMEKAALAQKEIDAVLEVLPMSSASVDHMMRTFQQQGRLVGLNFNQWSPQREKREKYYAKTAVKVKAVGTWNQVGEFFRRISELKKIVSIHDLSLSVSSGKKKSSATSPILSVSFTATTYRFLTDEERKANAAKLGSHKRRRRG